MKIAQNCRGISAGLSLIFLTIGLLFAPALFGSDTIQIARVNQQIELAQDDQKIALYLQLSDLHGYDDAEKAYLAAEQAYTLSIRYRLTEEKMQANLRMGRWSLNILDQTDRGFDLLQQTIRDANKNDKPEIEGLAWVELAQLYSYRHQMSKMDSCLTEAVALSSKTDAPELKGWIAYLQGFPLYQDYETDSAEQKWTQALVYFEQADHSVGTCITLLRLSMLQMRKRKPDVCMSKQDSARQIAVQSGSEVAELRVMIDQMLVRSYLPTDSLEQLALNELVEEIEVRTNQLPSDMVKMHFNYARGKVLKDQGKGEEALPYIYNFLHYATGLQNVKGMIQANSYLQEVYFELGVLDKSLELALAAKELAEQVEYRVYRVYDQISGIYLAYGELEEAMNYRRRSINYELDRGVIIPPYQYFDAYVDYSHISLLMDSLSQALAYADSALLIAEQQRRAHDMVFAKVHRGEALIKMGNVEQAEREFKEAQSIAVDINKSKFPKEFSALYQLGASVNLARGNISESIRYNEAALATAKDAKYVGWEIKLHRLLWETNKEAGNHQAALEHLESFTALEDSLFRRESAVRLQTIKTQFEAEEQALEIELLKRDNDLADLELAQQQSSLERSQFMLWLVVSGGVIIALLAFLMFYRYKLRKRAEELELQNRQLELEKENERAAQQVEMMGLRSSFLTNVSHEIRTPLTLIKGPLEMLKHDPTSVKPEMIASMEHNADRLMTLVNQAIRYAQLEEVVEEYDLQPVHLGDFAQRIHTSFAAMAREKGVTFTLKDEAGPLSCQMDRAQMEKAVSNLLSNAFRYTPPDGQITLRIATNAAQNEAIISVEDNGSGIAPEHLPHLFERYYRADTDTSTGFGVGLSIVKDVIEQHDGEVAVQSEVGVGTTFTLTLPAEVVAEASVSEVEPQAAAQSANGAANRSAKASVLVVEDNEEIRNFLTEILAQQYRVHTAKDGIQGEEMAKELQPQIIISDVMMPGQDGFAMVESLKNNVATSHIPIIMLTAKATQEAKLKGLSSGADDYLYKPVSPAELLLKIGNQLKQRDRLHQLFVKSPAGTQPSEIPETKTLTPLDVAFLNKAKSVVEENLLNGDFSTAMFCEEMALNRTSVHQKLKALTGKNTSGFIKSIRIQKAVQLIEEGNSYLQDVAALTGFGNRHSFARAFKEETGKTPSAFRDEAELATVENAANVEGD